MTEESLPRDTPAFEDPEDFADAFIQSFTQELEGINLGHKREKLLRSANRYAAHAEFALRNPDLRERAQLAMRMERGIVQTLLAHTTLDAQEALRRAVYQGLAKLAVTLVAAA